MTMVRRMLIGAVVAAVMAVGAVTASAGQLTVLAAIKQEVKRVDANATYRNLRNLKISTIAEAKAAIPKLKTIAGLFTSAASTVSASTAMAAQQPGKTDWVTGAREAARGFDQFATALRLAVAGEKAAAQKQLTAAEKTIDAGSDLGRKGDKILGLPLND